MTNETTPNDDNRSTASSFVHIVGGALLIYTFLLPTLWFINHIMQPILPGVPTFPTQILASRLGAAALLAGQICSSGMVFYFLFSRKNRGNRAETNMALVMLNLPALLYTLGHLTA